MIIYIYIYIYTHTHTHIYAFHVQVVGFLSTFAKLQKVTISTAPHLTEIFNNCPSLTFHMIFIWSNIISISVTFLNSTTDI